MTNRLAWAALWLAACGSSSGGSSSTSLGDDSATGERDAGHDAAVRPDAKADTGRPLIDCNGAGTDADGDGFTIADGDCDDCNSGVNPGAYDFPGDTIDDDCSGAAASRNEASCDEGLAIDSADANDGARAIGLCSFASQDSKAWGVVSARFTDANGAGAITDPMAAGMLPSFGAAKPSQGSSLLALSSGVARAPGQAGYTPECDEFGSTCPGFGLFGCTLGGTPPAGYPKESSSCRSVGSIFQAGTKIYNQAALELTIRVPSNVSSLSFDSIFYTSEYPNFICSQYNDFFVVFKEPKPDGLADGNIVFDSNDDPIGVNTGLLAVCDPSIQDPMAQKQFDCAGGTELLAGTGYGAGESSCDLAGSKGGASTGWLHTTAPVDGGELITIRFAIWDTNDPNLDSTILIDNFTWSKDGASVGTIPVVF